MKISDNLPKYKIDSYEVETKDSHKHLGVIIDNKLNFDEHIQNVTNSCFKKWALLYLDDCTHEKSPNQIETLENTHH